MPSVRNKRAQNKQNYLRNKENRREVAHTTRAVQKLNTKGRDDFGEGCHTTASEPYYYDSAYHPVKRPSAILVNEDGTCVVANEISNSRTDSTNSKGEQPTKGWECHRECKVIIDTEVSAIVHMRQAFDKPMHELQSALDTCNDGCPNQCYTRVVSTLAGMS